MGYILNSIIIGVVVYGLVFLLLNWIFGSPDVAFYVSGLFFSGTMAEWFTRFMQNGSLVLDYGYSTVWFIWFVFFVVFCMAMKGEYIDFILSI